MRYKNPFPVGVKLPEISVAEKTLNEIALDNFEQILKNLINTFFF